MCFFSRAHFSADDKSDGTLTKSFKKRANKLSKENDMDEYNHDFIGIERNLDTSQP
jgi:hypothetical protein